MAAERGGAHRAEHAAEKKISGGPESGKEFIRGPLEVEVCLEPVKRGIPTGGWVRDRLGRVRWKSGACVWLGASWVPTVYRRKPGFFEPVEQFVMWHWRVKGVNKIYKDESPAMGRVVGRWQWPPLPQRPVRGWRGQVVAAWMIAWQDRDRTERYFRRWTWCDLWKVYKGDIPFSVKLWRRVQADVAYCLARKQERHWARKRAWFARVGHRPVVRLNLRDLGTAGPQLELKRSRRMPAVVEAPTLKPMRTGSDWDERVQPG